VTLQTPSLVAPGRFYWAAGWTSPALVTLSVSLGISLLGGLAVQMEHSFGFGPTFLGTLVALYYLGWSIVSMAAGNAAQRFGDVALMALAVGLSVILLAWIAVSALDRTLLAILVFGCGVAASTSQPAANSFLARRAHSAHVGLAFGVKQAVPTAAGLLGGLAVPTIAVTVGWRWAFASAAILSVLVLVHVLLTGRGDRSSYAAPPTVLQGGRLLGLEGLLLAAGVGVGSMSSSAITTFLVSSAVADGLSETWAGTLLAIASLAALLTRVSAGALADRRRSNHLVQVSGLLALGSIGCVVLYVASQDHVPQLFLPGAIVAIGAGWGWVGIFYLAVIERFSGREARATSAMQLASGVGTGVGPLVFGEVCAATSYGAAWATVGAISAAGAVVMLLGARCPGSFATRS
jgi:MFS family permease